MSRPEAALKRPAGDADECRVCALLRLEYPNGRTHHVEVPEEVQPGQEITLYGHRWKVVGRVARRPGTRQLSLSAEAVARTFLCRQTAS